MNLLTDVTDHSSEGEKPDRKVSRGLLINAANQNGPFLSAPKKLRLHPATMPDQSVCVCMGKGGEGGRVFYRTQKVILREALGPRPSKAPADMFLAGPPTSHTHTCPH